MDFNEYPVSLLVVALGLLMFFGDFIGDRMREHRSKSKTEKAFGLGPLEGSLLGLLSLLLSFTFQMAAQRYDQRRNVLIEETNRIGTAVLRSDLFQKKDRQEVRGLFRDYVKARIAYYEAAADQEKVSVAIAESNRVSKQIWDRAIQSKLLPQERLMLIAALNDMIDVVTTRESMREATIPNTILWLLLALSFLSSIVIGYCTESRLLDSIIAQAFTVVVCLTVFIILDLDRPRRGFITLQREEKHLTALLSDLAD
jgi:protein-S-isoprenylcysteine O-methyltransferase Ste14